MACLDTPDSKSIHEVIDLRTLSFWAQANRITTGRTLIRIDTDTTQLDYRGRVFVSGKVPYMQNRTLILKSDCTYRSYTLLLIYVHLCQEKRKLQTRSKVVVVGLVDEVTEEYNLRQVPDRCQTLIHIAEHSA
jgi:hypothetical protein